MAVSNLSECNPRKHDQKIREVKPGEKINTKIYYQVSGIMSNWLLNLARLPEKSSETDFRAMSPREEKEKH